MLRKLMKYDLKYYRKIMLPLWAILIIYGIVHGINTVFNYETFYDHIPIKAQHNFHKKSNQTRKIKPTVISIMP